MEVPERLLSDFRALERYGHAMRDKHGTNFKRHATLDDAALCVYLDVYLPQPKIWVRVDAEHARKDNFRRTEKTTKKASPDQLSTAGSEEEEDE